MRALGSYTIEPCILEKRTMLGYRIPEMDYLPVYILVILGILIVLVISLSIAVHILRNKV